MSDKQLKSNMSSVSIWKKMNLTVEEASEYSGIGTSKIKELSNCEDCPFVLWNGAKRLIKRKQFEEYLSSQYSLCPSSDRFKDCIFSEKNRYKEVL